MSSLKLRQQIILYSHRLDAKSFVANHDGNLSTRMSADDRFLATPTARGKFDLEESDLIVVDSTGKTRAGDAKIFGEWAQHAAIYKARPDIAAVVHAHPPHSSAFGLSGEGLPIDFWPEGIVSLGISIPCIVNDVAAAAASAGGPSVDRSSSIKDAARRASACLVQGNGIFAWGTSVEQAYLRLELVEHLTQIYLLAKNSGTYRSLGSDAVAILMDKRKKAGLLSPEEQTHNA